MWAQDAFAGDNCLAPLGMNEAHEPQFYERVLCEELVYEGEYYRLLNAKKPQPQYNGGLLSPGNLTLQEGHVLDARREK